MSSVSSCSNELTKFVSNHILCYIYRHMLSSVMNSDGMTNELSACGGNLTETPEEADARIEVCFPCRLPPFRPFSPSTRPSSLPQSTRARMSTCTSQLILSFTSYAHAKKYYRDVIYEYLKSVPSQKCANCGCFSPAIRRDGYVFPCSSYLLVTPSSSRRN